jgi:hypothetical protein
VPSVMMGGRPAKSHGQPTIVGGRLTPIELGQPSPTCQSSPTAHGRGSRPVRALSPHLMIGKEHRSVMPTHPFTGVLTPKKITIRCHMVVRSSSCEDPLHPGASTRVGFASIEFDALHVLGQRVVARYDNVLIRNHAYKERVASSRPCQT